MNAKRCAAVILVVGCVGAGGWLLTRPASAPPPIVLHPTTVQVAGAQQHLTALGQAASRPGVGPRTLRLSETDLNVMLATSKPVRKTLALQGVTAVQIELQEPNVLVIHASVRVQGHVQNVQLSGSLVPDPKTGLRFAVSSVQAGRFPLPPALLSAQANQLAARFARPLLRRLSLSIQSVSIQKKELVISGIPISIGSPVTPASPPTVSPARH